MKYPIAIDPGNDTTAWGVVVPDLPGCFSAADAGLDEAIENAKESIALWIEDAISNGETIPKPSSITELQKSGEYEGWIWAVAEVDTALVHDKNISPVGWYVCSYLLRFVELAWPHKEDVEARFLSWENTVLVQANSIDEAYDKTAAIAKEASRPYKGGAQGVDVQWVFEGITEVLPIYEKIEDGAEIMWCERNPRKLKNLRALVRQRHEFVQ